MIVFQHPCLLWWFVLQDQVERAFQKQLSMEDMFEKRRVSLKKLAAKQTRPVQPVAPRPEAIIKSPMSSPGVSPSSFNHYLIFSAWLGASLGLRNA